MFLFLPACLGLFLLIKKEKMPDINQNEVMLHIEWNENIHVQENYERCLLLSRELESYTQENSALVGQQQFLLNRDRDLSSTEAEVYIKAKTSREIELLKKKLQNYFERDYPAALLTFSPVGNIFEKIFTTGEADLVVEYYLTDKSRKIDARTVLAIEDNLQNITGEGAVGTSFRQQINLHIDRDKLLMYKVPYELVYRMLRTAFKENQFATLRSQQQYLPILLGGDEKTVGEILTQTLIDLSVGPDGRKNRVALSTFVKATPAEDLKTIVAGKTGEYIPFYYYKTDRVEQIIEKVTAEVSQDKIWEVNFTGGYFSNKKMIREMMLILFVSIMLMYFILASQFENFKQPLIVLLEIPIDIAAALGLLLITGHSLNLMSAIGIVVTCGIIINDSILNWM